MIQTPRYPSPTQFLSYNLKPSVQPTTPSKPSTPSSTQPSYSMHPSPLASDPFPLPLIGQMGSFSHPSASLSEPLDLYLHGYVSSRIMNLSSSSTFTSTSPKGLPVCICASKVDGLVLSLTPYSHNYNHRPAILFGHASLVEEADERCGP
ncbi:hypothetical protein LARI1_G008815 [Lachnellula arida]|uniref:Uncharacterized protein n=1 Tax=Lachnellula arida TaxID=1316785 RepID=A0A8T9B6J2_9HELO|nr:hypothetical protein LARI1_G008815 [Lachnellula arida]